MPRRLCAWSRNSWTCFEVEPARVKRRSRSTTSGAGNSPKRRSAGSGARAWTATDSDELVAADVQERADHGHAHRVVHHLAVDLHPPAVLLEVAVASRELVGAAVVGLEHPHPGLDV